MRYRGVPTWLLILALAGIVACGDEGGGETRSNNTNNSNNGTNNQPMGMWTPEDCATDVDDDQDGAAGCADSDCYSVHACVFEPAFNPPDLPLNGVISLWERSSWLFEDGAVQRGVADGAIDPANIGTVTGRIVDIAGNPVPGASIAIANRPELGRTYTRSDGKYDIAFDAGQRIVLRVSAPGFVTSDREVAARLQRPSSLDDIVLVALESEGTTVDFSTTTYVAGTEASDTDGTRRTAVVIPEGTQASLRFPNGATQPLETMTVRATEVTVGEDGDQAMMAELPPQTMFTYAAEFSVDEAIEARAEGVEFDQPVFIYVDNFLGFAPGTLVPSGFYDRSQTEWEAMPDGIVLEVLDVQGDSAVLSIGGEGLNEDDIANLALTDGELALIAQNFEVGDTFWRVPTRHFSPFDFNWAGFFPEGTFPPPAPRDNEPNQCTAGQEIGSLIGCSGQTLGERIRLNGTPFTLAYQSGRTSGRKPVIQIPVIPAEAILSPLLLGAKVEASVAGQPLETREYLTADSIPIVEEYIWDGTDQFGRAIQGSAEVEAKVTLVYDAPYNAQSASTATVAVASAAGIGEIPPEFGSYPAGDGVEVQLDRSYVVIRRNYTKAVTVGTYDVAREGLGGWTVDLQHRYDPIGRTMYYGNGQDLPASGQDRKFTLVTGGADAEYVAEPPSDGDLAINRLEGGGPMTVGHDGVVYFAGFQTVYSIDPNSNEINRVAGKLLDFNTQDSWTEEGGDGGQARDAEFLEVRAIDVGLDGRLYIVTQSYVWRVEDDGTITELMGGGDKLELETGDQATEVSANFEFIAANQHGEVYVGDQGTIYKRKTDGRMEVLFSYFLTESCFEDQVPCSEGEVIPNVSLGIIRGFDVDESGDVYVLESGVFGANADYIRKIGVDGRLTTYAQVPAAIHIRVGNGVVMIAPEENEVTSGAGVVQVNDDGELVPRVGIFQEPESLWEMLFGFRPEILNGESAKRPVTPGYQFAVSPSGTLVFSVPGQIVRLDELFPGYSGMNYQIPVAGGSVIDEFTPEGRHLASFDALTGVQTWEFAYDAEGRLLSATDRDGDVTTIERDGSDNPTSIVGPNGVTWTMVVGSDGMLETLTSPENETWRFTYDDGLMTAMTNPRDETWSFTYDEAGRLIEDSMPNGGASTLVYDKDKNSVLFTSPEGRATEYQQTPPTNALRFDGVETGDLSSGTAELRDGWSLSESQDGSSYRSRTAAHPVYGMIASFTADALFRTPSGLELRTETTEEAETMASDLKTGLASWRKDTTNGVGTVTESWDASTSTLSMETGEGREATTILDAIARPDTMTLPGVEPIDYAYDSQGRVTTVTQATRQISMAYDSEGYVASITSDDGTVQFTRDAMGRVLAGVRTDGTSAAFEYDPSGNMTSVTPPGRNAYSMASDERGNMLTMTTPLGQTSTYTFDLDYRLESMTLNDGRTSTMTYDSSNRLDSVTLDGEAFDYVYAATGQLSAVNGGDANVTMTWDGPLPLTQTTTGVANGAVSWEWEDGTLNLSKTTINSTEIDYAYDTDGVPTQIGDQTLTYRQGTTFMSKRALGVVETDYTYNQFGEVASISVTSNGIEILSLDYDYDGLGRVTGIDQELSGAPTAYVYGYDSLGQLTSASVNGVERTYGYDANGNRTSVVGRGINLTGNELVHNGDDQVTRYGLRQLTYNDAGQLASTNDLTQITNYQYGMLGELERVTFPNGDVIEYEYDALRRRVAKRVNSVYVDRYIYGTNINPIAHIDQNGVETVFVYGTGLNVPDYMIREGNQYYFARDHLGSVRAVVTADTGFVVQNLIYDEYGQILTDSNPGFQPFGYAGGLYDNDTQLTRFGVRDYDAGMGRWTARDPIGFGGGQTNLYAYVHNSPLSFVDLDGRLPILAALAIGALVGGVAGGIGYTLSTPEQCRTNRGLLAWVLGGVVGGALFAGVGSAVGSLYIGGLTWWAPKALHGLFMGVLVGPGSGAIAYTISHELDPIRSPTPYGLAGAAFLGGASGVLVGAIGGGLGGLVLGSSMYTQMGVVGGTNMTIRTGFEGIVREGGVGKLDACGCQ